VRAFPSSRLPVLSLLAAVTLAGSAGCGGAPERPAVVEAAAEPQWQDVFETTPELLVALRPGALRQDKVYGPLLKRVIEVTRERSRVVSATRVLEVMEDAEEVIVGLRPASRGGDDALGEVVLVVSGVRASVDPARVVDSDGRALWTPGPSGGARELVRERDERGQPLDASLFELEGRTWVIALGEARARARQVFARPVGRPALKLDPEALAMVRVDGPSFVKRFRAFQPLGGLAAIGRKLQSLTLLLPPGAEARLEIVLSYTEEDAAAFAEVTARRAVEAIARKKPASLAWLAEAKVDRPDRRVVLTLPLPAGLVDSLLHAGSAPLDLDAATP
jgi:hypothetical protein